MFDVPDAKRVRRGDLCDSASEDEPVSDEQWDFSLRRKLNAQLSGLLDISFAPDTAIESQQPPTGAAEDAGDAGKEAFVFRLFKGEGASHTVVLEPQNAAAGDRGNGAFVVARRPASYYFAGDPSPGAVKRFRAAAVSAEYLLQDALKRRWGLEKPWRVTAISIVSKRMRAVPDNSVAGATTTAGTHKRKRPGKKRRIILRNREKAKKEHEETTKQRAAEKEECLKEKKKRLNRQRKLKRRAKEHEKKQGAKDEVVSGQGSDGGSPEI
ncbi:hypothetical protein GGS23DRAFT_559272 [Durotheca rogersii]|uniref:uncharacterized protein n=1 Tax=Durotheca rogersii TaxID=419775 RepID=UPI00221EFA80|nr:uncharacterized protein GGS23DRAFT_559272 [Durotheca rogersii]KAI5865451.1 hypothetical protein GGS23DRAFT_559272 [Durotheca rogersii]